jgi:tetratricopeptide (TPR) repeat protein
MIPLRRWLPIAFAAALIGGWALVRVQQRVDAVLAPFQREVDVLYLPSADWVKRLSLGYDGLLGSLYWTRAVQYYGREHIKATEGGQPDYRLLYPLLDITTTLDPELLLAYRFGSIFLANPPREGPGQPDLAVKLLEKGIQHNPDYWRFWWDMGFVYYRHKEYEKASQAFYKGAEHPEAAPWMRVMAARVAAEGGDREKARILWTETYNSTDQESIRLSALNHLAGLQVDEDIESLERIVKRYEKEQGRLPQSWGDLVAAGLLRGTPVDPTGQPYRLMPDGRVRLSRQSKIKTSTLGREQ